MRSYSKVILTAWLGSGVIQGQPGDVVEVTTENRDAVTALIKDRGCSVVYDAPPATAVPAADVADSEADSDDASGDGLSHVEDADSVDALNIAPRYVQALKDHGLHTIAQVREAGDLSDIPGVTQAAAKKIAAELA